MTVRATPGTTRSPAGRVPELPDAVRSLAAGPDAVVFDRLLELALEHVPGAELGGVCAAAGGAVVEHRAVSHPDVDLLDRAQRSAGEGPGLSVLCATGQDATVVVSDDLAAGPRWPAFARAAAHLGLASVAAFALRDQRATLGALTLYARPPGAFGADAEWVGAVLAAHAGTVLAAGRQQANLAVALESRDAIGQAKGILMERFKIDDRTAFEMLVAVSQHSHRKVREVADQVRTTGELPGMTA